MKKIYTHEGDEIFVDDDDFEFLSKFRFRTRSRGSLNVRPVLHGGSIGPQHLILGFAEKGKVIDHIDRNPFNNQRSNLRIATQAENSRNKKKKSSVSHSKYKGVSWNRIAGKWQVGISCNGKKIHVGLFGSEIEAARAYNKKAIELFGDFAALNELSECVAEQLYLPGMSSLTQRAVDGGDAGDHQSNEFYPSGHERSQI